MSKKPWYEEDWEKSIWFDDCWVWLKSITPKGYGQGISPHSRTTRAHRAVWEILRGPIPDGMQMDHICKNRACVNPAHLRVVTPRENILASGVPNIGRSKTHCPQRHEYTEENTYVDRNGWRECRECNRRRSRINHAKKRLTTASLH